ncbi:cytochrome C biogenesis protein CcdA [Paenibacillus sp. VTT E-133280]|uniref:Cytochrome C biogenesis protein CcdA n=3 Tax=Paenibacillaceae TaxID=186822 RepID=A0A7Z2VS89_9BACL|nr:MULTISPECIES: cytochrome c biogenesis protein CcdA [Paenibacillaceae]KKC47797.1 cytochrome C biogenesis protein DsbD [Paenibacillus sp. D9]MCK8487457.1 cytochrome C biogenesis protein CcdA [Paenibacillus mellifer]MCT1400904.1 cytochrome C biogenesis protein CcdA [Paenibacillus sp. p3-SID867]MEC0259858.1 cytochrome c biogenesis protein CcdA [Paenibacillus lautus]OZQ68833.1 cytochrome C biogenesis protein CcdA [Paenibacillus sp. VTT E-133280]
MDNLTILVAFAAGMLSFLSPCVFPLIPAYISHLTGSTFQDGKLVVNRWNLSLQAFSFIVGFSLIFITMGASASFIGRFFAQERELVQRISGLLIVVFGLQMAGFLNFRLLMSGRTWQTKPTASRGIIRSLLTGVAFGAGWSPCVGLALSSILLLAGSTETLWNGIGMLAVYSFGLGVPFLLISWLLTYSMSMMKKMNRWMPLLSKINGWLLIGMGLLLFTGQLQKISAWLSQYTFWDITF